MSDSHLPLNIETNKWNRVVDKHQEKLLKNSHSNKNRRSVILLLITFALPIILAKLSLDNKWLEPGVTNQGTLLKNTLTLSQLGMERREFTSQWLILYYQPTSCLSDCEQALATVYNSYVALGKDKPRVSTVLLTHDVYLSQSPPNTEHNTEDNKAGNSRLDKYWQVVQPSPKAIALLQQELGSNETILGPQVYIVDPLGNIILRHALPLTYQELDLDQLITSPINNHYHQLNLAGKAILTDMKKLLKYSKVG
jgi:hypothetical protein